MHGRLTRGRSRDEQGNPAISHSEDPFVPAEREKHLQGDEQEQLSEPSMAMHNQSAGPRSEQFCDPDGFRPLGLAMKSGHSETPEHTHCDPLLTGTTSTPYSGPTEGYGPSSSSRTYTEEQLGLGTRRNSRMQPTEILIHSTRPTSRGGISVHERGTSEAGPGFRPLSRAAQEIMEICSVDHTGCEDPDLESDTTTHTLHILEQELMATETWTQASVFGTGGDHHAKDRFTRWVTSTHKLKATSRGEVQSIGSASQSAKGVEGHCCCGIPHFILRFPDTKCVNYQGQVHGETFFTSIVSIILFAFKTDTFD
ncbi:hypothetical protein EYF80_007043 [Liparis tanakae]|uniref:Uncharacterized protein n=1 Tax=Liparis tanakae TaxID=230148 RepID=A0A4Z2IZT3_9TELE|nr:hypothetical protein EYF80_007043 [Liparis tanakae]